MKSSAAVAPLQFSAPSRLFGRLAVRAGRIGRRLLATDFSTGRGAGPTAPGKDHAEEAAGARLPFRRRHLAPLHPAAGSLVTAVAGGDRAAKCRKLRSEEGLLH
jgi:hypothetical protein